ncbi:histone H2A.V-like [Arvicola amphibius]|uniref:histone H2A.V-like n=1 Tax=Arvicola amphibius TaxID=1047088 RepID=UPI001C0916C1|nr:histone H2A.V-like [Arvicola amphibius]
MARGRTRKDSRKGQSCGGVSVTQSYSFPVGDIRRHLKTHTTSHEQVGAMAAGYSDLILENLTAEVLELAGNASKVLKGKWRGFDSHQTSLQALQEQGEVLSAVLIKDEKGYFGALCSPGESASVVTMLIGKPSLARAQ